MSQRSSRVPESVRAAPIDWPPQNGSYQLGDLIGPVAICVLTSEKLVPRLASVEGVAIVGSVQTANVGLEAIIVNTITNRYLRFLIVCGKESKLFRPGQSLVALYENGVNEQHVIIGAEGYEPQLAGISAAAIARFREQLALVDLRDVEDLAVITDEVQRSQSRDPGPADGDIAASRAPTKRIKPGGKRQPLAYDPKGYFVISVDHEIGEITIIHFGRDHLPAHEMHGRTAEPMLLGLLRERLVTQLSHAGYLGRELTKAETALRFGLVYTQDRPLHRGPDGGSGSTRR
jgi:tetrahydromethanopterin S-methyltransferase subunit A